MHQNGHADLISGAAGVIVALLALESCGAGDALRGLAVRLGDELVRSGVQQENVCFWKSPLFPAQRPLTGLSHGAAGIGYALLELFQATGNPQYRETAERAFNYERACFDEGMRNWPDFRGIPTRNQAPRHHQNFPVFWCHGAPGIALSRLRAYEILRDDRYKFEAVAALRTTKAWTEKMLGVEEVNFCLCHGLAGNAHILARGSESLAQDFAGGDELAREVAAAGIRQYARRDHRWPFGMLGHRAPGLMAGLSGVGLFYLALCNPTLPSFFLLEGEKVGHRLRNLDRRQRGRDGGRAFQNAFPAESEGVDAA
jgi:lantibiotic modifying enzyme